MEFSTDIKMRNTPSCSFSEACVENVGVSFVKQSFPSVNALLTRVLESGLTVLSRYARHIVLKHRAIILMLLFAFGFT